MMLPMSPLQPGNPWSEEDHQWFRRRVTELRKEKFASQQAAADACTISQKTWSKVELGTAPVAKGVSVAYRPSLDTIVAIARTLGIESEVEPRLGKSIAQLEAEKANQPNEKLREELRQLKATARALNKRLAELETQLGGDQR